MRRVLLLGTICWTVQLIPQVWKSWRAKSTEGLSHWLVYVFISYKPVYNKLSRPQASMGTSRTIPGRVCYRTKSEYPAYYTATSLWHSVFDIMGAGEPYISSSWWFSRLICLLVSILRPATTSYDLSVSFICCHSHLCGIRGWHGIRY